MVATLQFTGQSSDRPHLPFQLQPITMRQPFMRRLLFASLVATTATAFAFVDEWKSGIEWPEPVVVTPGEGNAPPSDAIVLFNGENLDAFDGVSGWTIEDGVATVGSTVSTKQKFGDCQLHLEFASPAEVKGKGQGRGNSGVYLMGRYELQILDSYDNQTYFDGQCGAIYKQQPPLVNVCRPPGEWQTYDIIFRAPRFNADGGLMSPAAMTVLQNGVLVQNHFELQGGTFYHQPPAYQAHPDRESIQLQHHGNPVRFRNIWIRDLQSEVGE
ncbi:MAG: DUF1080 domain-containing protein [Planctomycetaceae bacterium]